MHDFVAGQISLYKQGIYDTLDIFPKQEQALGYLTDDHTTDVTYGGAARGGKSVLGCKWIINECLSKPSSRWLVAREEMTKLRDTTMDTFFKELSGMGMDPKEDFRFNGSSFTLDFYNGSKVFFREIKYVPRDPEFDRLGSYDLTGAFLDEAQQIHIKAVNVLRGRFSELTGEDPDTGEKWETIPKMFFSCNPSKTWVYKDFFKPNRDGTLIEWRKFVQALPTDNPHNSKAYLTNMLKSDARTVQRLYYGNWDYDDDPACLIDWDSIQDFFTNKHVTGKIRYLTADIALQGSDRFIIAIWEGWRVIHLESHKKTNGKEVIEIISRLARIYAVAMSNIAYDNDGLGSFIKGWMLTAYSFKNGSKPLYQRKSKADQYEHLKAQCYYYFAERVQLKEAFFDAEISLEDREELEQEMSWIKNGNIDSERKLTIIKKKDVKEGLGRSPDYTDCLIQRSVFDLKKPRRGVHTRN